MPASRPPSLNVEEEVRARYSAAAKSGAAELCCGPPSYDPRLLAAIPEDVIQRDYGCGDPTRYVKPGETVLDLGSGSGKACFLASQIVGREGRIIGVDMNDEMLALARRSAPEVAHRIGYANVVFKKGRIQDLRLDLELLDQWLKDHPVRSADDLARLEAKSAELRERYPLVGDDTVDVVVSNCVLNLVQPADKQQLFREIFRVLRPSGRAAISDIVSDGDVPEHLQRDPELWTGCISGALREDLFLDAFEQAGFHGVSMLARQEKPWRTVEGIEFRSVTVAAYKGKERPCCDQKRALSNIKGACC